MRRISRYVHGMANFDEHLSTQINQMDADEAAAVAESNTENYAAIKSELQRLQTLIADLSFAKNHLDQADMIAESAKLIASYADAMQ